MGFKNVDKIVKREGVWQVITSSLQMKRILRFYRQILLNICENWSMDYEIYKFMYTVVVKFNDNQT